jgi:hypothetical protein
MVFIVFTELYDHPRNPSSPKETPYLSAVTRHAPSLRPLEALIYALPLGFAAVNISYDWSHDWGLL